MNLEWHSLAKWTRPLQEQHIFRLLLLWWSFGLGPWRENLSLQCRHDERNGVPNHQLHDCLLKRLIRRRSKKTSKLRVTGLCEGNSVVTGEFLHKEPVTQRMFPFDDVIIIDVTTTIWDEEGSWTVLSLSHKIDTRAWGVQNIIETETNLFNITWWYIKWDTNGIFFVLRIILGLTWYQLITCRSEELS